MTIHMGIIVLAIIVSIVIVVAIVAYSFNGVSTVQSEKEVYCENWAKSLMDRKVQLESVLTEYKNAGFLERLDYNVDLLNEQMNQLVAEGYDYNKECYY